MIKPIEHWLTLDQHGIQMPWYVRPFLQELITWNLKDKYIFEYGCGYSSLWYRSRGALLYGVDNNETWASLSGVRYEPDENWYLESISFLNVKFDIVIIDGTWRDRCTKYALKRLVNGGKLIIDNWEQPSVEPNDWTETKELIKWMDIEVYKEPTHPDWKTAVITK